MYTLDTQPFNIEVGIRYSIPEILMWTAGYSLEDIKRKLHKKILIDIFFFYNLSRYLYGFDKLKLILSCLTKNCIIYKRILS